jgi:phenylacetate-coenzyme A ligase PaaK-like adenylate-forming protein
LQEDLSDLVSVLNDLLYPWYSSLEKPKASQEETLATLLRGYEKTEYGKKFGASAIGTFSEFQNHFPITNYIELAPYFEQLSTGNYSSLFPEPVSKWVMTRGTTGSPKIIPTTETHLSQIFSNGARAISNFALKRKEFEILGEGVLNLNFPSQVRSLKNDKEEGEEEKFGYSSGTYAKLFPTLGEAGLVPRQEEIDSLGGGITKEDWERRFERVYELSKRARVGSIMGVTPVLLSFARYLKGKHGIYPRDIWKMRALFCTSVAKIQTKYSPTLRYFFGDLPIIEMYTATEGVFAQQLYENIPYLCPNYDTYFFEVLKPRATTTKMLCDMKKGEWGRMIISSCLFSRYDIGDLVECVGEGYFRVLGRATKLNSVEHILYDLITTGRISI